MPSRPAVIRPTTATDLGAIAQIFAYYVTNTVITFEEDPPSVRTWHDLLVRLSEQRLPFLVAEVDGTVAGYAYVGPWRPKPAYRFTVEDSVYLTPECRGMGLGRLLVQGVLEACPASGVRQVLAVIADTGEPASIALHRACGFTQVGRLIAVGHKHGRWIDTVILQRPVPLASSPGSARG
jgi:L-amino acid N-acyltransferase YncA